ncbi:MAG: hypothetical protein ACKVQR_21190 [Aquabacterium sp.]
MKPSALASARQPLAGLEDALRRHDPAAVAAQAAALHQALLSLLPGPGAMRRPLAPAPHGALVDLNRIAGRLAMARQTLARQAAAAQRALEMMWPPETDAAVGYGPDGLPQARTSDGAISA